MINDLKNFVAKSRFLGKSDEMIQAGGGNTSFKDESIMRIKASGFLLSEMTETSGYVSLPYRQIIEYFEKLTFKPDDIDLEGKISNFVNNLAESNFRPSMEASMHAFLDKFVLHTHPVFVNIFSCANGAEILLQELFKNLQAKFYFIDYVNPGYNLGYAIYKKIPQSNDDKVIILQNHGLIVSSDDAHKAYDLTMEVNSICKKFLNERYKIPLEFEISDLKLIEKYDNNKSLYFATSNLISNFVDDIDALKNQLDKAFFPDFIVFSQKNCEYLENRKLLAIDFSENAKIFVVKGEGIYYYGSEKMAKSMHSVLEAVFFILQGVQTLGTPHYISYKDVSYICNMETEEYRKKLIS